MLNASQVQQLKQSNISTDGDATRERVEKLWKAAAAEQKQAVLELADVVSATIYRVYKTGSLSAKLAVPLAQVLNINPFYLTGEADKPGECSEVALRELLLKHGYKKIVAEANLKRPYTKQQQQTEEPPAASAEVEIEPEVVVALAPQLPPNSDALTGDDLHLLLNALNIQAKAGIASAKDKLNHIKLILLT